MKELFLSKQKLSGELLTLLNKEMNPYGFIILNAIILDIEPPKEVKETMNMVLSSQNKREAMINQAKAEKEAAILKAEGLCETRRLEGLGLASQRQSLVNGLKESIEGT
jgi:regulator of protease activity HflC (stomatin/prohibitin superfamily)